MSVAPQALRPFAMQSREALPSATERHVRLLLIQPVPRLLASAQALATRRPIEIRTAHQCDQVPALLEGNAYDLIIAPLTLPVILARQVRSYLATHTQASTKVVLYQPKPESSAALARAATIPGAKLICGKARMIPRVIEELASATGVQPRVHVSPQVSATARITLSGSSEPMEVILENISTGGAKIQASFEPEIEETVFLEATLPGGEQIRTRAMVVRCYSDAKSDRWHIGLSFLHEMSPEALAPLGKESDSPELFRLHHRVRPPPLLSVKLRINPRKGTSRHYLKVIDVSESGVRAFSQRRLSFSVGTEFDALLLWEGASLSTRCSLVRSDAPPKEASVGYEYAFRFTEIPRIARAGLRRLLASAEARQLVSRQRTHRPIKSAWRKGAER